MDANVLNEIFLFLWNDPLIPDPIIHGSTRKKIDPKALEKHLLSIFDRFTVYNALKDLSSNELWVLEAIDIPGFIEGCNTRVCYIRWEKLKSLLAAYNARDGLQAFSPS